MVKELLVGELLTEETILAGRRLIEAMERYPLDGSALRAIDAAFWAKESRDGNPRWQLYISSPGISFEGPRKGYEWVHNALNNLTLDNIPTIPFDRTVVTDTNNPAIDALRDTFKTGIQDYRSTSFSLKSYSFDDIYMYRVDPARTITCPIQWDDAMGSMAYVADRGHLYVFGRDLPNLPAFAIIGHGHLKKNGTLRAALEIPIKYGIESSDQIRCTPFIPITIIQGVQEPEPGISSVIIEPVRSRRS